MKTAALILIAAFLCVIPVRGEKATTFEYGKRPPLSVFDPDGVIAASAVREISKPLMAYEKDGIDVLVIILKDLKGAPPEHVANEFAAEWCHSPIHCVVLHVPGNADSPWIVPAGVLVTHLIPSQVRQAVSEAHRRAALEPDDTAKVKAASTEAADMLRYWFATALNRSELIQLEAARQRLEAETRKFKWKMAAIITLGAMIPILVGTSVLVVLVRRRGPAYFPKHDWQPRLGAPHAGGNQAVTNLGPPNPGTP